MSTEASAPESSDPKSTAGELHPVVRKILADIRIVMVGLGGLIVVIFLSGWTAFGQIEKIAKDEGEAAANEQRKDLERVRLELRAHVEASILTHKLQAEELADVKRGLGNVERLSLETNANLRIFMESRGLKPITLDPDGGR